jgi:hypothetical protein
MNAKDEKTCRDLVAYIAQPPLSDDERGAHVQGVGRYLRARGGEELVGEAYEFVRGLGYDMSLFDCHWLQGKLARRRVPGSDYPQPSGRGRFLFEGARSACTLTQRVYASTRRELF